MKKAWVKTISYVAMLAILLVAFPVSKAIAAYDVTTPREITVTFSQNYEDLENTPVDVSFYRVASMNSDGSYTVDDRFAEFAFSLNNTDVDVDYLLNHANDDSIITASTLLDYSLALLDYVDAAAETADVIEADATCQIINKSGVASVTPGLYLIVATDVKTAYYDYRFTPAIAFVPNTTELELKAEEDPLTADLIIEKTLTSFANLTGTPLFIFDIVATDLVGNVVYSDVISLSFTSPGTRSALITGIPAGSSVTIREVYAGASYDVTSAPSITMVLEKEPDFEADENTASFTNDYGDRLVYGTGVVNHYEVDNSKQNADGSTIYSWSWSQEADNSNTNNGF